jgi:RNA polymerase sigma-70 factor (ECF subfamily)
LGGAVVNDLVERAREGDHAAFRELIDLESHRCYAIAIRIVRDVERAHDAVQQTFLVAWRELPRLRDPDRFQAWLFPGSRTLEDDVRAAVSCVD